MSQYSTVQLREIVNTLNAEELNGLFRLIEERREAIGHEVRRQLKVGDKVRFNLTTRPRMLAHRTATVTAIPLDGKIVVDLAYPIGKWFRNIRVPLSLVEVINA